MSSERVQAGRFRLVLVIGAVVHGILGVLGVFSTRVFEVAIGAELAEGQALAQGFDAVARLYGGVLVAVAVGYGISVVQRHRALLAILFAVPLVTAATTIAVTARGEVSTVRGMVWAAFYLVYCLVFLRLYPRRPESVQAPGPGDLEPAPEEPSDEDR